MGEQIKTDKSQTIDGAAARSSVGASQASTGSASNPASGQSVNDREVRHYRRHATDPRTHIVRARVGESELAALDEAARKVQLTVGSWLAEVAADAASEAPLISGQQYGEVRRLNRELRRVGVNLNQIAAKVNAGKGPADGELERVIGSVGQMCRETQVLVDAMLVAIRRTGR